MSDAVVFNIRKAGHYLNIELETFNNKIDMGLFDEIECESLRASLLDAVFELNEYIEKSHDTP
jgi:hypothetical protein